MAVRLAMWDWSWLSHHVPGGAFADWPKVLAEARERGFDTIRLDPLPDLVALDPGEPATVRLEPSGGAVPWLRVPAEQVVDPVAEVVAFCTAAVDAGLRLILSTWGLGRGRSDGAVRFGAYPGFVPFASDEAALDRLLRGWDVVIDALAPLHEHVEYVDLNNELDLVLLLASPAFAAGGLSWDWDAARGAAFRDFAEAGIRHLHERYPHLRATASACGPIGRVGPWYPRNADVLEWHAWYSEPGDERLPWVERVAHLVEGPLGIGPVNFSTPERRAGLDAAYRAAHAAADPTLRLRQDRYLERVKALADERGLPAFLGEGYATPWYSDAPELSWGWVKDVSAAATATVRRLGFAGYTNSNFSEPTFPLWADADWHRATLLG